MFVVFTQNFRSLVGSVWQNPLRGEMRPSQCDVQLTPERLIAPPCNQPSALKQQERQITVMGLLSKNNMMSLIFTGCF